MTNGRCAKRLESLCIFNPLHKRRHSARPKSSKTDNLKHLYISLWGEFDCNRNNHNNGKMLEVEREDHSNSISNICTGLEAPVPTILTNQRHMQLPQHRRDQLDQSQLLSDCNKSSHYFGQTLEDDDDETSNYSISNINLEEPIPTNPSNYQQPQSPQPNCKDNLDHPRGGQCGDDNSISSMDNEAPISIEENDFQKIQLTQSDGSDNLEAPNNFPDCNGNQSSETLEDDDDETTNSICSISLEAPNQAEQDFDRQQILIPQSSHTLTFDHPDIEQSDDCKKKPTNLGKTAEDDEEDDYTNSISSISRIELEPAVLTEVSSHQQLQYPQPYPSDNLEKSQIFPDCNTNQLYFGQTPKDDGETTDSMSSIEIEAPNPERPANPEEMEFPRDGSTDAYDHSDHSYILELGQDCNINHHNFGKTLQDDDDESSDCISTIDIEAPIPTEPNNRQQMRIPQTDGTTRSDPRHPRNDGVVSIPVIDSATENSEYESATIDVINLRPNNNIAITIRSQTKLTNIPPNRIADNQGRPPDRPVVKQNTFVGITSQTEISVNKLDSQSSNTISSQSQECESENSYGSRTRRENPNNDANKPWLVSSGQTDEQINSDRRHRKDRSGFKKRNWPNQPAVDRKQTYVIGQDMQALSGTSNYNADESSFYKTTQQNSGNESDRENVVFKPAKDSTRKDVLVENVDNLSYTPAVSYRQDSGPPRHLVNQFGREYPDIEYENEGLDVKYQNTVTGRHGRHEPVVVLTSRTGVSIYPNSGTADNQRPTTATLDSDRGFVNGINQPYQSNTTNGMRDNYANSSKKSKKRSLGNQPPNHHSTLVRREVDEDIANGDEKVPAENPNAYTGAVRDKLKRNISSIGNTINEASTRKEEERESVRSTNNKKYRKEQLKYGDLDSQDKVSNRSYDSNDPQRENASLRTKEERGSVRSTSNRHYRNKNLENEELDSQDNVSNRTYYSNGQPREKERESVTSTVNKKYRNKKLENGELDSQDNASNRTYYNNGQSREKESVTPTGNKTNRNEKQENGELTSQNDGCNRLCDSDDQPRQIPTEQRDDLDNYGYEYSGSTACPKHRKQTLNTKADLSPAYRPGSGNECLGCLFPPRVTAHVPIRNNKKTRNNETLESGNPTDSDACIDPICVKYELLRNAQSKKQPKSGRYTESSNQDNFENRDACMEPTCTKYIEKEDAAKKNARAEMYKREADDNGEKSQPDSLDQDDVSSVTTRSSADGGLRRCPKPEEDRSPNRKTDARRLENTVERKPIEKTALNRDLVERQWDEQIPERPDQRDGGSRNQKKGRTPKCNKLVDEFVADRQKKTSKAGKANRQRERDRTDELQHTEDSFDDQRSSNGDCAVTRNGVFRGKAGCQHKSPYAHENRGKPYAEDAFDGQRSSNGDCVVTRKGVSKGKSRSQQKSPYSRQNRGKRCAEDSFDDQKSSSGDEIVKPRDAYRENTGYQQKVPQSCNDRRQGGKAPTDRKESRMRRENELNGDTLQKHKTGRHGGKCKEDVINYESKSKGSTRAKKVEREKVLGNEKKKQRKRVEESEDVNREKARNTYDCKRKSPVYKRSAFYQEAHLKVGNKEMCQKTCECRECCCINPLNNPSSSSKMSYDARFNEVSEVYTYAPKNPYLCNNRSPLDGSSDICSSACAVRPTCCPLIPKNDCMSKNGFQNLCSDIAKVINTYLPGVHENMCTRDTPHSSTGTSISQMNFQTETQACKNSLNRKGCSNRCSELCSSAAITNSTLNEICHHKHQYNGSTTTSSLAESQEYTCCEFREQPPDFSRKRNPVRRLTEKKVDRRFNSLESRDLRKYRQAENRQCSRISQSDMYCSYSSQNSKKRTQKLKTMCAKTPYNNHKRDKAESVPCHRCILKLEVLLCELRDRVQQFHITHEEKLSSEAMTVCFISSFIKDIGNLSKALHEVNKRKSKKKRKVGDIKENLRSLKGKIAGFAKLVHEIKGEIQHKSKETQVGKPASSASSFVKNFKEKCENCEFCSLELLQKVQCQPCERKLKADAREACTIYNLQNNISTEERQTKFLCKNCQKCSYKKVEILKCERCQQKCCQHSGCLHSIPCTVDPVGQNTEICHNNETCSSINEKFKCPKCQNTVHLPVQRQCANSCGTACTACKETFKERHCKNSGSTVNQTKIEQCMNMLNPPIEKQCVNCSFCDNLSLKEPQEASCCYASLKEVESPQFCHQQETTHPQMQPECTAGDLYTDFGRENLEQLCQNCYESPDQFKCDQDKNNYHETSRLVKCEQCHKIRKAPMIPKQCQKGFSIGVQTIPMWHQPDEPIITYQPSCSSFISPMYYDCKATYEPSLTSNMSPMHHTIANNYYPYNRLQCSSVDSPSIIMQKTNAACPPCFSTNFPMNYCPTQQQHDVTHQTCLLANMSQMDCHAANAGPRCCCCLVEKANATHQQCLMSTVSPMDCHLRIPQDNATQTDDEETTESLPGQLLNKFIVPTACLKCKLKMKERIRNFTLENLKHERNTDLYDLLSICEDALEETNHKHRAITIKDVYELALEVAKKIKADVKRAKEKEEQDCLVLDLSCLKKFMRNAKEERKEGSGSYSSKNSWQKGRGSCSDKSSVPNAPEEEAVPASQPEEHVQCEKAKEKHIVKKTPALNSVSSSMSERAKHGYGGKFHIKKQAHVPPMSYSSCNSTPPGGSGKRRHSRRSTQQENILRKTRSHIHRAARKPDGKTRQSLTGSLLRTIKPAPIWQNESIMS